MSRFITGLFLVFNLCTQAQKVQPMAANNCMEVVTFKPKEGVSNEQLMEAMRSTNAIVKNFDGFLSRSIAIDQQGGFIDVVYWESLSQALRAAQQVQEIPEVMEHFALIDPKSIKMSHFEVFTRQE